MAHKQAQSQADKSRRRLFPGLLQQPESERKTSAERPSRPYLLNNNNVPGFRYAQFHPMFLRPGQDLRRQERRPSNYSRGDGYVLDDGYPDIYRMMDPFAAMHINPDYPVMSIDPRMRGDGYRAYPNRQGLHSHADDFSESEGYAEPPQQADPDHTHPPREPRDVPTNHRPKPKAEPAPKKEDPISFGKALAKLHRELGNSGKYYKDFNTSYNADIENIKKYATKEIMDKLWELRVAGKKDPKAAGDEDDDADLSGNRDAFDLLKTKTDRAFNIFLNSDMHDGASKDQAQEVGRLKEKIKTASRHISELMETALKEESQCKDLLDELRVLGQLVNPRTDKNKKMRGEKANANANPNCGDDGYNNGETQNNEDDWEKTL